MSDASSMGVFWLHVGSFVAYDGLVGYLLFSRAPRDGSAVSLPTRASGSQTRRARASERVALPRFHHETPGIGPLGLFAVAMALHFLVDDFGLRDRHREPYRRYGRWLRAGAVVSGGALGALTSVDRALLGASFAFLSGGIVLDVIEEELPPRRESRFSAFAAGAGAYAAVLL